MRLENIKTKTDWESVGVIPDIYAENEKSLIVAQKPALANKLSSVSDETEKRKISWIVNYLQSQDSPLDIAIENYIISTGRYAEFEITIRDSQLVFRDTNQPIIEYKKMIAITPQLFQIGKDYQVELLKDDRGEIKSIRMFWNDGWTEIIGGSK